MEKEQDLFVDDIVNNVIDQNAPENNADDSNDEANETIQIDTKLAEQIDKLQLAFERVGIKLDDSSNNRKDIIDYAKFVNDLNQYFSLQKNSCVALKQQYENKDDLVTSYAKRLSENNDKIKELFELVLSFFVNPPSKEFLDLANHSALFKKLYDDFKNFSDRATGLNLNEILEKHKEIFEKHLDEVSRFQSKIEPQLEHVAKKYKDFTENMLKTLNEQLIGITEQIKAYHAIRDKYEKTTKSLTRGLYALISLCSVLCVGAGAFLGYEIFILFH